MRYISIYNCNIIILYYEITLGFGLGQRWEWENQPQDLPLDAWFHSFLMFMGCLRNGSVPELVSLSKSYPGSKRAISLRTIYKGIPKMSLIFSNRVNHSGSTDITHTSTRDVSFIQYLYLQSTMVVYYNQKRRYQMI